MFRRDFFKRAAAALAGLCGGASTAAARPLRQVSRDVTLVRCFPTAGPLFEPIDWFDQRPGDLVRAFWPGSKRTEYWLVTGPASWTRNGPGGREVETVQCRELTRDEAEITYFYRRGLLDHMNEALARREVVPFRAVPLA